MYRTLFIGDAAGFPKPTSGGGVYTGVVGVPCSRTTCEACNEECCRRQRSAGTNSGEQNWAGNWISARLFSARGKLTGEEVDQLIRVLNDPSLKADILMAKGTWIGPASCCGAF